MVFISNGSKLPSAIFKTTGKNSLPFNKNISYRIYPTIPSAPDLGAQNSYHVNTLKNEYQELIKLHDKFNEKYEKYS